MTSDATAPVPIVNTSGEQLPNAVEENNYATASAFATQAPISVIDDWLFASMDASEGMSLHAARQEKLSADINVPPQFRFVSREYMGSETKVNLIPSQNINLTGTITVSFNELFGQWTAIFESEAAALQSIFQGQEFDFSDRLYVENGQSIIDTFCDESCRDNQEVVVVKNVSVVPDELSLVVHNIGTSGMGHMIKIGEFSIID